MVEGVPAEEEQLDQVAGDVTAGNVQAPVADQEEGTEVRNTSQKKVLSSTHTHTDKPCEVRQCESLIDRADVGDPVAAVHHHPRQQALGVQRQHGLEVSSANTCIIFFLCVCCCCC